MRFFKAWVTCCAFVVSACGAESGDGAPPSAEEHAAAIEQRLQEYTGTASYSYPAPEGWLEETYAAPQPWAPDFPWSGAETVHFPPGWPDAQSPEWWSYDYAIWVESGPKFTADALASAFKDYYEGLVGCGTFLPCDPSRFVANMRRVARVGSTEVFEGSVDSYDFSPTPVPITLHLLIVGVTCPMSKHRALLVSASPKPIGGAVWAELLDAQFNFRCR